MNIAKLYENMRQIGVYDTFLQAFEDFFIWNQYIYPVYMKLIKKTMFMTRARVFLNRYYNSSINANFSIWKSFLHKIMIPNCQILETFSSGSSISSYILFANEKFSKSLKKIIINDDIFSNFRYLWYIPIG